MWHHHECLQSTCVHVYEMHELRHLILVHEIGIDFILSTVTKLGLVHKSSFSYTPEDSPE